METCIYYDPSGGAESRALIRDYEWYFRGRSKRMTNAGNQEHAETAGLRLSITTVDCRFSAVCPVLK